MKRETATRLSELLVQTIGPAIAKMAESPSAPKDAQKLIEDAVKTVIVKRLLPLPEPTSKQADEARHSLKNYQKIMRREFLDIAKRLPRNPGGRDRALAEDKVRRSCQDMATLLYQGVEKVDACKRIAARYHISIWTMNRYWREYQRSNPVSLRKGGE